MNTLFNTYDQSQPNLAQYKVRTIGKVDFTTEDGPKIQPDSFTLIKDHYIAVQFKNRKVIQIYTPSNGEQESSLYMQIDHAISRNGKSFCIYDRFLAIRNLKHKCFEIIDIEAQKSMLQFAYEDIWYYNNYHVLGHIFVFPHYMRVSFFDSTDGFKQLDSKGVDYDWYKNDDSPRAANSLPKIGERPNMQFQKKFVILKDSNTICFDSGEGRIQIYSWQIDASQPNKSIVFSKSCSLRDHQIAEVIDTHLVSVTDFAFNGTQKLFDVKENRVLQYPPQLYKLNASTSNNVRSRTFSSVDGAFSLSRNE